MSVYFDTEKDNANFFRIFRRVFTMFTVLICIYLTASTYAILINNPSYIHDWRGVTCIVLTILAFLMYVVQFRMSLKMDWPPPLRYAVGLWASLYLVVLLLTLINTSFVWDFYVVFAISFGLFGGVRLLLAVSIMALTMFAFQGLLVWPPTGGALVGIASQALTLFSITGFNMLFQHLIGERFERNRLVKQLTQTNGELEEAHRQLAQSVAQEQELAVLRERTRLAREMHDTIGHALVLISVKLEAAQRLRERDPERCDCELESTKEIARETMTALRSSIADLRSPALEREQINHALSRSAREFARRSGLHITYTLQADIDFLPEAIEETLWKVSQEAFANIEKHAHASHVQVRISRQDEKLLLHIHDDGVGLPQALCQPQKDGSLVYSSPNGHYGLRGMLERVEATGGHLTLHSGKEQGTTIEIELPLAHRESMEEAQKTREQGRE
ncbi:MAG: sensor histidine kinase [Ktedonobacteraceae bacterium]